MKTLTQLSQSLKVTILEFVLAQTPKEIKYLFIHENPFHIRYTLFVGRCFHLMFPSFSSLFTAWSSCKQAQKDTVSGQP